MARNTSPEPAAEPMDQLEPPTGRVKQIFFAYRVTKKLDPKLTLAVAGWGALAAALMFVPAFFTFDKHDLAKAPVFALAITVLFMLFGGLAAAMATLSRRVQRAAYKRIEGELGAGASVLEQSLKRGKWTMSTGVQFNRQQDLVHRLIGKGGILLVGEGDPNRLNQLMANERRAISRYLGPDVEVDSIIVGDDTEAGQIPLGKLNQHVTRIGMRGRKLTGQQAVEYTRRLKAVAGNPVERMLPKGPLPRGGRIPRGNLK
jgi:hypothetical protein